MIEGLLNMFRPEMLLTLVLGAFGGAIVGGLPGLTATMAIALLVPFTFSLGPMTGFVAIGALYAGAMYGDSIPACLVNTPGTPSALATTFDGYPMTLKGKGQHALLCSGIASAVGSLIGGFALLALSPPLAKFSLQFGPPEYFWIGVFGMTMIASLASGSLAKGLAGGALGMLVSTVGIAPAQAHARFTFGMPGLLGGINLVPALMGLFAIPQALRLVEKHRERPKSVEFRVTRGAFAEVTLTLLRRPMTLIRSCGIGTIVGILPAAGGPIASLIAYAEERRWSPHPEEFGKGSIAGLTAAEAANNAAAPASFIPLLALGVPGSAPAAVALGALMLHGLQPGQALYTQHADIVYTFIWSMILAGLVILLMAALLSQYLSRIAEFPVHLLAPLIMLFCVVGAFAIRSSVLDVGIMLGFGLAGYTLEKLGFDAGPIVLGLVLGPVIESALVSSLAMIRADQSAFDVFLFRPLAAVLVLLTLLSVLWPTLSEHLFGRSRKNLAEIVNE